MPFDDVVKQLSEALTQEGNTRAVFGEPVKLETKTIIPVACIQLGAGGGGVLPAAIEQSQAVRRFIGGGGGGAFSVFPVGYLHEEHGEVVFTPIHLDVKNKPFLTEASHGIGKAIDTVTGAFSAYAKKLGKPGPSA